MPPKRRRIIDDDDDDENENNDMHEKSCSKNDIIQRMLRNTKTRNSEEIDNNKKKTKKAAKKEGGIPRKTATADDTVIPRSKPSSKEGNSFNTAKKKENNETKAGILTQSMLPAPPTIPQPTKSKTSLSSHGLGGVSSGRSNKVNNTKSKSGTQFLEGVLSTQISPVRIINNSWSSTANVLLPPPQLREEERRVLSTLKNLCSKVDLRMEPIDDLLSGSFLSNIPMVDLMDENIKARIPIFPEDFPPGGPKEWPLSWWGIADNPVSMDKGTDKEGRKRSRGDWGDRGSRSDRNYHQHHRNDWHGPPLYDYHAYREDGPPPYKDRGCFSSGNRSRR